MGPIRVLRRKCSAGVFDQAAGKKDEVGACPKADRNDERGLGQVQSRNKMSHLQRKLGKGRL